MRECLRCKKEMIEDLELTVSNGAYGLIIKEKGLFKNSISKLKCAVCPYCGYTETYVENKEKLRKY